MKSATEKLRISLGHFKGSRGISGERVKYFYAVCTTALATFGQIL